MSGFDIHKSNSVMDKSMVNFTIRDATFKDAAQLSLLYKIVWNEQRDRFPNKLLHARQPNLTEMQEWLSRETYFVAVVEERIIGVVGCVMNFDNCKLIHMVVQKEYRKKGIGSALLEEVVTFANKNNAFKIWLDTSTRLKDSIKFYKSKGFRLVGTLKKHFWGEDIVLFEKIL